MRGGCLPRLMWPKEKMQPSAPPTTAWSTSATVPEQTSAWEGGPRASGRHQNRGSRHPASHHACLSPAHKVARPARTGPRTQTSTCARDTHGGDTDTQRAGREPPGTQLTPPSWRPHHTPGAHAHPAHKPSTEPTKNRALPQASSRVGDPLGRGQGGRESRRDRAWAAGLALAALLLPRWAPGAPAPALGVPTALTCSESWGKTASKANILGATAAARRGPELPGGPAAGSYRVTCFLRGSTFRKDVGSAKCCAPCAGQIRNMTFTWQGRREWASEQPPAQRPLITRQEELARVETAGQAPARGSPPQECGCLHPSSSRSRSRKRSARQAEREAQ